MNRYGAPDLGLWSAIQVAASKQGGVVLVTATGAVIDELAVRISREATVRIVGDAGGSERPVFHGARPAGLEGSRLATGSDAERKYSGCKYCAHIHRHSPLEVFSLSRPETTPRAGRAGPDPTG